MKAERIVEPPPLKLRDGWVWECDEDGTWTARNDSDESDSAESVEWLSRRGMILCRECEDSGGDRAGTYADVVIAVIRANDPSIDALFAERDRLATEVAELRRDLANAEGDARILAHAYEHDSRPPTAVVARALAYRAGRPAASEDASHG